MDSVSGESDTGNNCSSGVRVTVEEDAVTGAPNLVVESPSVSDSTLTAGETFTFRATVHNRGAGPSEATTLRYYRSDNSGITTGDTQVGIDSVSGLPASVSSPESVSLTAPSAAGTYYYGACVDSVSGESSTGSNNCSSGVRVTVEENAVTGAPDLVVESPSVSDSALTAGETFTFRATVHNRGAGPSEATTLRYYRSDNSGITTGDTQVGIDSVSGLSASDSSPESETLTAPSAAGTYYYGACVDSVSGESSTGSNNCSSGVRVTVEEDAVTGAPNLVVESPSVSDSTLTAGETFTFRATVHNRGAGPSEATTLRYYRSDNSGITTADTQVGTDSVSGLSASDSSPESVSLTAPSTARTYYYGACVDSVSGESSTGSNNCSSGVRVTVEEDAVTGAPNLVVESPSVSDSTLTAGETFTFRATVHNRGAGPSEATTLRYYRSDNSGITTADTQVGTDSVSGLPASDSSPESVSLTAPSAARTYYYGACVDSVSGESSTGSNNCSSGVRVTVEEDAVTGAPNLVVESPSVSDSTLTAGETFTFRATVHNRGAGPSEATTLRYYRSDNSGITTADTQVGTDSVSGLSASDNSPESVSLTAPSTARTYYYGACVDSVSGESNTGNNCSTGVRVTVSDSGGGNADVLVSNVGQTSENVDGFSVTTFAQSFTTGANPTGYTLTSIELKLFNNTGSTNTPTVKLFSGSANGMEEATFTGPPMLAGEANYTFTPTSTVNLGMSTTYWVVAEGPDGVSWISTASTSEDATPATGWLIGDRYEARPASSTGGFTPDTGRILQIRVNGTTVGGTVSTNTAPTSMDAHVEADEDTDYAFAIGDFTFTDTDTGDSLASIKIVTLPASGTGTLTLSGTTIVSGDLPQTVLAAEINNLEYSPAGY